MNQTDMGASDYNTDRCSDSMTLLLHTPPGVSAWWWHTGITNTSIHQVTGNKTDTWQNMASHTHKDSTPNTVFILYFLQQLSCWWRPIRTMNSTWRQTSPVPDITESAIFITFLAIIIQMGHYAWDSQKDYRLWLNFLTPFDSRQLHVTGSYIFFDSSTVNHNATDNNDPKYHRLKNIHDMLEILRTFETSDCGFRLNFKQYIPKQCINFGINSYKLCIISKRMNDMDIYFGNSRAGVTANRTVSHANVRHGHTQYKDKLFHCLTYWTVCQRGKSTAGRQYMGADKSLARPGRKQATFPTFYGTWRFITTFTTVHHLSLP